MGSSQATTTISGSSGWGCRDGESSMFRGLSRLPVVGRRAGSCRPLRGVQRPGSALHRGRPGSRDGRRPSENRSAAAARSVPLTPEERPWCTCRERRYGHTPHAQSPVLPAPPPPPPPPATSGRAPCCSARVPWDRQAGLRATGPVTTRKALRGRPPSGLDVRRSSCRAPPARWVAATRVLRCAASPVRGPVLTPPAGAPPAALGAC